jgi:hypothetical protein
MNLFSNRAFEVGKAECLGFGYSLGNEGNSRLGEIVLSA